LMCAKNRIIIFCSLLDIWENVLLDIRENVEWPHFFWPTLYTSIYTCTSACSWLLARGQISNFAVMPNTHRRRDLTRQFTDFGCEIEN